MSLSKAFADIIFNILEGNSSIDIENSEILCNAIKEFLGRRTTEECWKLIPDAHQATLLESLGLVKSRTNSATRRIHSTLRQEIAECVKLSDKYIMDHFESLNPEISKDLHRFVAAIRGFQFTIMMSDNYYPTPWSLDPNIFGDPTSRMSRFSRLHEGTKKLKAGSWAWRLALLCFNHEVEYNFSAMLLHEETDTRNFEGIIYEKIAESFNMSTKYFKRRRNTAVFYTKLLVQAGPGSILMIGENSNHLWQESITLDEIDKIVNFIKDQLPKCYHRIKSFDQTAAEMIVSGLCAYGWTLAELRQTQSSLLSELRKHIDLEKCEDNSLREMRHTDATSVVHRNNENAESTPEPRAKRRREDMISVVHQNNKRAEPEPEPMAKRQKGTVKKNMALLDHDFEPSSSIIQLSSPQNTRFWNEYGTNWEPEGPQEHITNAAAVPMIIQNQNNLSMFAMPSAAPAIDPWMYAIQLGLPNQPEPPAELFYMPNSNP
ncbi:hypothetical protein BPOR_0047g00290 [Botrytis porri]|uniref:Uncharacterized protein n=1 Tax=Botrytis porri TaxID=87229 RepID=A0A4Z1L2H1_9HELO|nr:hypothetical protein BPOR_0047g00290 [Botrytis porri]